MPDPSSSAISRQTIKDLASLARLYLTANEEIRYQQELASILQFVNQLEGVDVSDCAPLYQVTGLVNRWRDDGRESLRSEQQPDAGILLSGLSGRLVDGQFKAPRLFADRSAANKN